MIAQQCFDTLSIQETLTTMMSGMGVQLLVYFPVGTFAFTLRRKTTAEIQTSLPAFSGNTKSDVAVVNFARQQINLHETLH